MPNSFPFASPDTYTFLEDAPLFVIEPLINDTDVDNDPLRIIGYPQNDTSWPYFSPVIGLQSITLRPNGTQLDVLLTPDWNGTASFDYTISDGNGGEDTATITINVTAVNDAPVTKLRTVVLVEDRSADIPFGQLATDVDNDPLTFTVASAPANGTVTVTASGFTYTPKADYFGPDRFEFDVTDGTVTRRQEVILDVLPENDAPVAVADNYTLLEDAALVALPILANDSDVDGDPLSIILSSFVSANGGQITVGTHQTYGQVVYYTPPANFSGTDSFRYRALDQMPGRLPQDTLYSSEVTVTIDVTPVSDAPQVMPQPIVLDEDGSYDLTLADFGFSDPFDTPADALKEITVFQTSGPTLYQGPFTLKPEDFTNGTSIKLIANGYPGLTQLNFTVTDTGSTANGGMTQVSGAIPITVTPLNDAPTIAIAQSFAGVEDQQYADFYVAVWDEDFLYPVPGPIPAVTVTVTAIGGAIFRSGGVTSGPETLGNASAVGAGTDTYVVNGTDLSDINKMLSSLLALPVTPHANSNTGTFVVTATVNDNGAIGGGPGLTDGDSTTLTILAVNDAPEITIPGGAIWTSKNAAIAIPGVSVADVDLTETDAAAPIEVTLASADGNAHVIAGAGVTVTGNDSARVVIKGGLAAVNTALGTLSFNPDPGFSGFATLQITADDLGNTGSGGAQTDTELLSIEVINTPPTATDDTVSVLEDASVTFDVTGNDTDPEGDPLSAMLLPGQDPQHGTVVRNADGSFTYAPDADFYGTDSFGYTLSDGDGGTDTGTVAITVDPVSDAPSILSNPRFGTLQAFGGVPILLRTAEDTDFVLTPADFSMDDRVDRGPDEDGLRAVTLTSTSAIAPPGLGRLGTFLFGGVPVTAGTVLYVNASGQFTDASGTVTSLVYRPDPDANGISLIDVSLTDTGSTANGGTVTGTFPFAIVIDPVNDAPTVAALPVNVLEDTPSPLSFTLVDPDWDGYAAIAAQTKATFPDQEVGIAVSSGTLDIAAGAAPVGFSVSGAGTASIRISGTGTLVDFLAVMNAIEYTSAPDRNDLNGAPVTVTVLASDGGSYGGSGEPTALTGSFVGQVLSVLPTNDAPFVTLPINGPVGVWNSPVALFGVRVDDPDLDETPGAEIRVTLTAANGITEVTATGASANVTGNFSAVVTLTGTLHDVNASLATARFIPDTGFFGTASLTVTANDQGFTGQGDVLTDSKTLAIDIERSNSDPVAVDDGVFTYPGFTVVISPLTNDSDPDLDPLTATLTNFPTVGTAVQSSPTTISFTSPAAYGGSVSFDYMVHDPHGGSDTGNINVIVAEAPATLPEGTVSVGPGATAIQMLTGADRANVNLIDASDESGGIVEIAPDGAGGQVLFYTPAPGTLGETLISFTLETPDGTRLLGDFAVLVTDGALAAADDALDVSDRDPHMADLLANDTFGPLYDPDLAPVAVVAVNDQGTLVGQTFALGAGWVTVGADGQMIFDPAGDYAALDTGETATETFTYTLAGPDGATDTAAVTLTVLGDNDAPRRVETDLGAFGTGDPPIRFDVAANVIDPEGDPVTASDVTARIIGGIPVVAQVSDGLIEFDPAQLQGVLGTEGNVAVEIIFRTDDGRGGTMDDNRLTFTLSGDTGAITDDAGSQNLTGTDGDDRFVIRGGGLDLLRGLAGQDRFDLSGLLGNGTRDVVRILDYAADEVLDGISPTDVFASRARPGQVTLILNGEYDMIVLDGIGTPDDVLFGLMD